MVGVWRPPTLGHHSLRSRGGMSPEPFHQNYSLIEYHCVHNSLRREEGSGVHQLDDDESLDDLQPPPARPVVAAPRGFEAAAGWVHYNNVPAGGPAHTDHLGLSSILRVAAHARGGGLRTPASSVQGGSNSVGCNMAGADLPWTSSSGTRQSSPGPCTHTQSGPWGSNTPRVQLVSRSALLIYRK